MGLQMRIRVQLVVVRVHVWAVYELRASPQELTSSGRHLTEPVEPLTVAHNAHSIPTSRRGQGLHGSVCATQLLKQVPRVKNGVQFGPEHGETFLEELAKGTLLASQKGLEGADGKRSWLKLMCRGEVQVALTVAKRGTCLM
eukprot:CAMPEP_0194542550 /NCGR_PEP_ID=MMETSP0253-20130528/84219_1 /TAXON_ID=2966 /ORGANISM="Noctiluca scintillans" /LENGTH=141 /DNA_ID=CAMNT_0039389187 /DNA_START=271 /DNA_END=697 /DNA_ORIENTATION=-